MLDIFEIAQQKVLRREAKLLAGTVIPEGFIQENDLYEINTAEITVIICGSPCCGKTTFINRFLGKTTESVRSTLFDFNFTSRLRDKREEVISIWELGGGAKMARLLTTPITIATIEHVTMFVFFDLTTPSTWDSVVTELVGRILEHTDRLIKEIEKTDSEQSARLKHFRSSLGDHADARAFQPLAFTVAFFAARYDQFQNFETEKKKALYKFLRFIAHIHRANIMSISSSSESLISKAKDLMFHIGYHTERPQIQTNFDVMKPLCVPAGRDSFEAIGALGGALNPPTSYKEALTQWRSALQTHFPCEEAERKKVSSSVINDKQFVEYEVDLAIEQRQRELEMHLREKSNRRAVLAKAEKSGK